MALQGGIAMASSEVQRKLTAILCADVVGYSRLMGDDPEGTLRAFTEFREVFSNKKRKLAERNQGLPDPRRRTPLHTREPAIYGFENIEATAGVVSDSGCGLEGVLTVFRGFSYLRRFLKGRQKGCWTSKSTISGERPASLRSRPEIWAS